MKKSDCEVNILFITIIHKQTFGTPCSAKKSTIKVVNTFNAFAVTFLNRSYNETIVESEVSSLE